MIKKPNRTYISLMLCFAAGAMLGASFFTLLPESFAHGNDAFRGGGVIAVLGGLIFGVGFVYLINMLDIGKCENERDGCCVNTAYDKTCEILMKKSDKRKLKKMGIAIFIAMALHSLPEGLAIGAGEYLGIGLLLGVVFFLHFVPEGLAIAVPMKASGIRTWKILLLCAGAGLPAVLGAIAAYYIGMVNILLAFALSFAAGAMSYVVLSEMLPMAYHYTSRYKLASMITLAGALLIIVFTAVL
jgi:ZIP family zinc transporter